MRSHFMDAAVMTRIDPAQRLAGTAALVVHGGVAELVVAHTTPSMVVAWLHGK